MDLLVKESEKVVRRPLPSRAGTWTLRSAHKIGGWVLKLYQNSWSIAFSMTFYAGTLRIGG
ncbi:hypothetical protein [Spirosoma terrae]|uniref:Uncharacterized protein n=1 Tax=Spirosoma terrae TaxID=1968276 RepID=A0A6L9LEM9_9BACT|nr:hypothetical protein [Spirosoma terrae]NDU96948.1 hypothetical protein [Spirosoma terrae]